MAKRKKDKNTKYSTFAKLRTGGKILKERIKSSIFPGRVEPRYLYIDSKGQQSHIREGRAFQLKREFSG